ncbi:peptidase, partial [Micromonospora craterilacus]
MRTRSATTAALLAAGVVLAPAAAMAAPTP